MPDEIGISRITGGRNQKLASRGNTVPDCSEARCLPDQSKKLMPKASVVTEARREYCPQRSSSSSNLSRRQ